MILFPPAKINLGLNVLQKRSDGFHEIQSCMAEIPLCDVLELIPADSFEFQQTGLTIDGDSTSNLCVRAYHLMVAKYAIPPVYMHLIKQIPMGAGLGGGSSDAAFVLKGLNTLFELELEDETLEHLAAELGSDCAFFIRGGVQFSQGRGEVLRPISLDLKGIYLKLVYPDVHISTAEAYSNVTFDRDVSGFDQLLQNDFSSLRNSFEQHVFQKYPELEAIKNELDSEGAFYAAMSGSGSTIFGLFRDEPEKSTHENSWVLQF